MKPLIPYLRQSRTKERTITFEQQWDAIAAWAKANKRTLTVTSLSAARKAGLVEEGVSGNKAWRDRELGKAIAECTAGRASGVIVYDQSRLTREGMLGSAEVWDAINKAGAQIVAAIEGGPIDEFMYGVKALMYREQWKQAQARGISSKVHAHTAGKHTGATPLGYRRVDSRLVPDDTVVPVRAEAEGIIGDGGITVHEVVSTLFRMKAAGQSYTDLQRFLNMTGVCAARSRAAIRGMLHSRVYLGELSLGDLAPAITGAHDPITDEATWQRAQATKAPTKRSKRTDLLGGFLRCSHGHRMSITSNKTGYFWRCTNDTCTDRATVSDKQVVPFVVGQVLDAFMGAFDTVPTAEDHRPALEAAVAAAERDLREVESLKGLSPARRAQALTDADAALEDARKALGEAAPLPDLPPRNIIAGLRDTAARDNAAATEMLRGLIARSVERVEVRKGRMPLAEKVRIVWREPYGGWDERAAA